MENRFLKRLKEFSKIIAIYFVWICIHYCASHLYVRLCTRGTFIGFILSPFLVSSPHCQALRWCILQGANQIVLMWATIGTWFVMKATLE
jgi:hypothetical protein